jgi:integrase
VVPAFDADARSGASCGGATLVYDEGLSARIGADHLGHSKVSMTQDRYMTRCRVHTQVADLLDRIVTKSGE